MRAFVLSFCLLIPALDMAAQAPNGQRLYENSCGGCHGGDGNGGELAPAIITRIRNRSDEDLAGVIRTGLPNAGMPGFKLNDPDMAALLSHLRTLRPRRNVERVRLKVETTAGATLDGLVMNRGPEDLQLLTDDRKIHLLRKTGARYRPVTSTGDWAGYHGQPTGNRHSALNQINKNNVGTLAAKWIFSLANTSRLQVTPIVADGVMYVTSANECYALDAGSGREIWHYRRPRTVGLIGNAAGGINRGATIAGNRVFMVTDHAHIIALDKANGTLLWDTEMADWRQNYNATSAPLVVGNLVISGTAGGDEGVRGFLAAFDQATGKEVWRFWTTPKPGEPGSETWKGKDIEHPCASTWFTGSYDAQLDTLYWTTGNPCPDFNGDERIGDNLWSDSVIALDPKTGKMKWFFQYTPHDVWDWDAQQPAVLVDARWEGQPRKLLLQANRNGFFYVLDRVTGKLLLAKPFVKKMTWAKEIGADGRPVKLPNMEPTLQGTVVCPTIEGATNWFSTSFSPDTGYYYVQALEKCGLFTKAVMEWRAGQGYMGGSTRQAPTDIPQKVLRAIDISTGKPAWEIPQTGPGSSWGGVMSTAGGVVFYGDDSGSFAAVDAATGKPLWEFPTNHLWKASPMTYMFDGRQYVAIASGSAILTFALPGSPAAR